MQSNNSAGEQKASLPFVWVTDGHGNKHKVIDLEDTNICPRDGIMIFEATTRKNESRANDIPFKACKDKASGVMIGICVGHDPDTKNLRWLPIQLGRSTMFNLEIEDEAKKAACLLRSNIVEGSPNLSSNIKLALFRVHDEMKAATLNIKRIKDGQRALLIAEGLVGEDLINQARNLGVNTEHTNLSIILSEVLSRAEKNPAEFLRVWENPNRDQITIFNRGVETGIITHDPITGYYYRGVPLGMNEAFVVDYFNKHKDIASSIDMMSKERNRKPEKVDKVFVDPEKLALEQRVQELQAQLAAQSAPPEELQAEFDSAYAEAKDAGVKPLHVFKATREGIDKLKAATEKAKEKV